MFSPGANPMESLLKGMASGGGGFGGGFQMPQMPQMPQFPVGANVAQGMPPFPFGSSALPQQPQSSSSAQDPSKVPSSSPPNAANVSNAANQIFPFNSTFFQVLFLYWLVTRFLNLNSATTLSLQRTPMAIAVADNLRLNVYYVTAFGVLCWIVVAICVLGVYYANADIYSNVDAIGRLMR